MAILYHIFEKCGFENRRFGFCDARGAKDRPLRPLVMLREEARSGLLDEEYCANGGDGEDELTVLDLKWLAAMNLDASCSHCPHRIRPYSFGGYVDLAWP